jgi:hypothetical protein
MLRATGAGHGPADSGLYRTEDGDAHWTKLDFPGDFDGSGPSALCGEVLAFHPLAPNILLAGTESMGFYRSGDEGKTWQRVLPEGQRFTAVGINAKNAKPDGKGAVHAVTCPDHLMEMLGRGRPARTIESASASDYRSRDGGLHFRRQCERTDLGYYAFTFSFPQVDHVLTYGTSHGMVFTYRDGRKTHLYSSLKSVERLRPMTAAGTGRVRGQTWPRTYAQVLDPEVPDRASCAYYKGQSAYQWIRFPHPAKTGVLAIIPCDRTPNAPGNLWWFLCTDALYRLDDAEHTFNRVFPLK